MGVKKRNIGKIFKLGKKYKYLIFVVVVGIVLLALPGGENKEERSEMPAADFSLAEFEARVADALSSCAGVGRVKVMLAIKSGMETVYAKEERINQSSERKDSDTKPSIMSDGSGREVPVTIKQVYPKFQGATVICDGADDMEVRACIIESVSALTGIAANKICVIKMERET